jgi:DNA-binding LytR/AlgR family response regulator
MLRIIFCDDDAYFLNIFMNHVNEIFSNMDIETELIGYDSPEKLMEDMHNNQADSCTVSIDALFLDIDMKEVNGFEIAEAAAGMSKPPLIVFISNMDHLVYDSFTYNPFWFLRKSDMKRLSEVLQKLAEYIQMRKDTVLLTIENKKISISVTDIVYIESDDHYVMIHTQSDVFRYKANIGKIAEKLKKYHFVRCHSGFIVSCRYIAKIEKGSIKLKSGKLIPVSRSRQNETVSRFMEYIDSIEI